MKRSLLYIISVVAFVFFVGGASLAVPQRAYAAPAADAPELKCPVDLIANPFTWIVCPVIQAMTGAVGQLDNFINKQMSIGSDGAASDPNQIFCNSKSVGNARTSCDAYYTAWKSVRNIALGLMAIAGIIVLIAQALGTELLDAYTIRKILPRLLISAIAITLSWQLMQIFVTFSNDLAYGVRYIIYQPFSGLDNPVLGGGAVALTSLLELGALTALGWIGLLSFLGTALLAVFIAVLVLILRQLLIVMLIIFAPIAIAAYILPNTQKIYKIWWEWFSKALLMFALISGMIAMGRVFSALSALNADNGVSQMVGFAAYFLPYFLIPLSFKFAGGAMSQIGGFVNDRSKGGFDRLKGYRGNVAKKNFEDLKTGNRLRGENIRGYGAFARTFNRGTRGTANLKNAGYSPRRAFSRMGAAQSTAMTDRAKEALEKNSNVVAIKADDDLVEASLYAAKQTHNGKRGGDYAVREELTRRGYANVEQGVALVRSARDSMDTASFDTSMAIASFGTSSGWTPKYETDPVTGERTLKHTGGLGDGGETGAGGAREMINMVAGGDRQRAIQMLGAARQQAESKGRFDLSGGSFTEDAEMLQQMLPQKGGAGLSAKTVTQKVHRGVLEGTGRGRVFGGHKRAIDALAPEVKNLLDEGFMGKDGSGGNAQEAIRQLAFAANTLDAANANSAESAAVVNTKVLSEKVKIDTLSPEVRQAMESAIDQYSQYETKTVYGPGDKQISQRVKIAGSEPKELTYGQLMEAMRSNQEFGRYRREYGRYSEEAAAGRPPAGPPEEGA